VICVGNFQQTVLNEDQLVTVFDQLVTVFDQLVTVFSSASPTSGTASLILRLPYNGLSHPKSILRLGRPLPHWVIPLLLLMALCSGDDTHTRGWDGVAQGVLAYMPAPLASPIKDAPFWFSDSAECGVITIRELSIFLPHLNMRRPGRAS
jgi:hypothetical protein